MSLLIVISSDDLIQLNPRLGSIAELIGLLSSAMLVRNYSSSRQDIHGNGVGQSGVNYLLVANKRHRIGSASRWYRLIQSFGPVWRPLPLLHVTGLQLDCYYTIVPSNGKLAKLWCSKRMSHLQVSSPNGQFWDFGVPSRNEVTYENAATYLKRKSL